MRLFFAIMLPDDVRGRLVTLQNGLRDRIGREGVRWEDPAKFHVTLQFLGDVPTEKLEAVKRAGQDAASACTPFSLELSSVGAFPDEKRPRVLWVGAQNAVPEFARLEEYLLRELRTAGFAANAREARPHVTLGRIKSPAGAKSTARALAENNPKKADKEGVIFVYNIELVDSELRPRGSVYTVLETFPLAAV